MAHPEQAAMQSAQATTASLAAATASLAECEDLAAQTGSELLEQRQTLQRTRDKTHELEYQNKKAAHTLRGMTFWGSIVKYVAAKRACNASGSRPVLRSSRAVGGQAPQSEVISLSMDKAPRAQLERLPAPATPARGIHRGNAKPMLSKRRLKLASPRHLRRNCSTKKPSKPHYWNPSAPSWMASLRLGEGCRTSWMARQRWWVKLQKPWRRPQRKPRRMPRQPAGEDTAGERVCCTGLRGQLRSGGGTSSCDAEQGSFHCLGTQHCWLARCLICRWQQLMRYV